MYNFDKVVYVEFGRCNSCGRRLRAAVTGFSYLDNYGRELDRASLEAHCNEGGHSIVYGSLSREEFLAAENGEVLR